MKVTSCSCLYATHVCNDYPYTSLHTVLQVHQEWYVCTTSAYIDYQYAVKPCQLYMCECYSWFLVRYRSYGVQTTSRWICAAQGYVIKLTLPCILLVYIRCLTVLIYIMYLYTTSQAFFCHIQSLLRFLGDPYFHEHFFDFVPNPSGCLSKPISKNSEFFQTRIWKRLEHLERGGPFQIFRTFPDFPNISKFQFGIGFERQPL